MLKRVFGGEQMTINIDDITPQQWARFAARLVIGWCVSDLATLQPDQYTSFVHRSVREAAMLRRPPQLAEDTKDASDQVLGQVQCAVTAMVVRSSIGPGQLASIIAGAITEMLISGHTSPSRQSAVARQRKARKLT